MNCSSDSSTQMCLDSFFFLSPLFALTHFAIFCCCCFNWETDSNEAICWKWHARTPLKRIDVFRNCLHVSACCYSVCRFFYSWIVFHYPFSVSNIHKIPRQMITQWKIVKLKTVVLNKKHWKCWLDTNFIYSFFQKKKKIV